MNRQDIFDTVVTHLFTQGHRAGRMVPFPQGYYECTYLDQESGDRCAVGCLLEDREDGPTEAQLSKKNVGILVHMKPEAGVPAFFADSYVHGLLNYLQMAHDTTWHGEDKYNTLEYQLRDIARRFSIEYREQFYPEAPKVWE